MYLFTYYKMGNRWFLDLPEYIDRGGDSDDLERIGAFHDFLEMISEGETTLMLQLSTLPFEGADVLELTGSAGPGTGGYYQLRSFEGSVIDLELWFNIFASIDQQGLAPRLYLKRVRL
ncbi:hypothetical protein OCK74_24575 [Chitinophagaceae bacterium LB-8]|uniref:Uncharacterized protein n=1 Tax=Paraflavisolibacter caeni TaxID=2982496 RepID=A0A9X2Y292_9BACT|nr:DUF6717 family protein [Paraflavisolibacter caeni]MCU7552318.1 hypothetical protein [Paraflavisolibacter caeni]